MNFIDLPYQQSRIRQQIDSNIAAVLDHGQYVLGPEVSLLEQRLAEYVGVEFCLGVSSGTDALLLALMALGVGQDDEVITTPFTFIATGEVIALLGAKCVFVDINPKTYNINPTLIEQAITDKTKAIMPVSLYGQCADFDAINQIAKQHDLPVIEDGAQSFGATYKGRKSCGLSTVGCSSFFPSKPLGGYGDSGAIFTNDADLAKKMRELHVHGQDKRYHHPVIGINGRMDTLQAAILLAKFDIFPEEVSLREKTGLAYSSALASKSVVTPFIEEHNTSVYAQYTIQVDNRDDLQQALAEKKIPSAVHYPVILPEQAAFAGLNYDRGRFPVAESLAQKVISLPMHPYLSEDELMLVVNAI